MVARLFLDSVSLAQKPKSAAVWSVWCGHMAEEEGRLTDLDISNSVEENVITFDVSVNDVLAVQMS